MKHGLFTSWRGLAQLSFPFNLPRKPWKVVRAFESFNERSCSTNMIPNYEAAVEALNSLQSNAAVLEKARLLKDRQAVFNIPYVEKYLGRIGIPLEEVDNCLPVIHVSGTKGKGSTCAFCESILKHHGLKTGFYSSPHLIEVRERIRINGKPLSKEKFAEYFWEVYTPLNLQKDNEEDMPAYFKFMTIMAFHVFLKEKVDVAIIEVGIGGLYDCTNVIRKPRVVGISSLGLDHLSLLGDTVEKIAVHKAGIMKSGVPAYTVRDQPGDSMRILKEKALEVQCPLYVVPALDEYQWTPYKMKLGLPGQVQLRNASLALQLSRAFLEPSIVQPVKDVAVCARPFQIHLPDALGLSRVFWPGRSQIFKDRNVSYYIDGAHTPESIEACVKWFKETSHARVKRVLVFNTTGDRNPSVLLEPLRECRFDVAIFCPNVVDTTQSNSKDLVNLMVTMEQQIRRCELNRDAWLEDKAANNLESSESHTVLTVPNINAAVEQIRQMSSNVDQLDVLVTGSLHLVGGLLSLLDPELSFLLTEKHESANGFPCPLQVKSNGCYTVPGTP